MRVNKYFQISTIFWLAMFTFKTEAQQTLGEAPQWPAKLTVLPKSPVPALQTVTGGFAVNTDSREQVRDFFNAIYPASENVPINSTADVADCYPGTNSPAFMEAVLRRINWFRAMAGESANVVFNSIYNSNAQAVAVMISSSGMLNHNPPTDWPCYSPAGAAGAGGNQAGGFNGADAITAYIWDFGTNNFEVGHRRWILFPQEQIMGTGDVPATNVVTDTSTNIYIAGNSTYVFDSSINSPRPATRQPYVAWPPEGFTPYQVVFPYWSFALSNADLSAATVTMTSNGVPVTLAIQPYQSGDENNQSGAGEDTLVWVPMGLDATCECTTFPFNGADTVYGVTVSNIAVGASSVSFTYNVTVFDPNVPGADYVPTAIAGPAQAVINAGNSYACTPLNNTNTTSYQWLTARLVSGNIVENAGYDLSNTGLVNFTYSPAPAGYPLLTNAPDGSGGTCFHLCHLNPTSQYLTLNEVLFPATNTVISFDSLLGYATGDETACVQVSTDGGGDWQNIYAQAGSNNSPVFTFFPFSLSLSNFAGQPILLRFNFSFTGGIYYPESDNYVGWCLENIVITNTGQIIQTTTNSTTSTNFVFTPTQSGSCLLQAAPVIFSQFPLGFGPVKLVSVTAGTNPVILLTQPVLTNKQALLNFTVINLTNATFHLLQATQLNNVSWTTNTTALFTTNIPNSSYRFTATNTSALRFYRVQTP